MHKRGAKVDTLYEIGRSPIGAFRMGIWLYSVVPLDVVIRNISIRHSIQGVGLQILHVKVQPNSNLVQVVLAPDIPCSRFCLGEGWQQQRGKNRNDCNDNQQLDERECWISL